MGTVTTVARPRAVALAGYSPAQGAGLVLLVALVVAAPFFLYTIFVMKVLCYALFACAFNLLIGYTGLLSFGHAAFFGMGSYVAAYTLLQWGATPEVSILAGGVTGAGIGLVAGAVAIRRLGIYFSMITLALAQMIYFLCLEAPFTGGEDGIQQVPRGALFGLVSLAPDRRAYWLVAVVFLAGFMLVHRVAHSPFGQVLKAIRDNEPRAVSLGYRCNDYKLLAFVLSAALSGVAGGVKAFVFGIATLSDVHWSMSGQVVLMTLLGGMGTVFGPVVGALTVAAMETYLAQFGDWVTVLQGLVFVVCVLAFRRGIVGEVAARLDVKL
jgi:branched-chain amino acid transport system permease protein